MKLVSIVTPLFNESLNVNFLYQELIKVINEIPQYQFEIIMVDDGSQDDTFSYIEKLSLKDSRVNGIKLSKNFGHQNALRAGLEFCHGDCAIMMDGDLQHPPALIKDFIKHWEDEYQIVNTVRTYDNYNLKSIFSYLFYQLLNKFSPVVVKPGMADFRLLDRVALDHLLKFKEYQAFYRGLVSLIGLKEIKIPYKANARHAGVPKYNFKSMLRLAVSGITSLSTIPLYFSTILGIIIFILSFIYGLYVIAIKWYFNIAISGWTSLILSVLIIGGAQMVLLGIIGLYIDKIFWEVKGRPPYLIAKISSQHQHE